MNNNFLSSLSIFINFNDGSGRGVHGGQRSMKTESDINALSDGHKPSLELTGGLAPVDNVRKPHTDGFFPQQDSIEGIPGDKIPFWNPADRCDCRLVCNIKDSPAR